MSVRSKITEPDGIFFITITCYKSLRLFEVVNGYDILYKQFDILRNEGHLICGYSAMLNHAHVLIAFSNTGKNINNRFGALKRFMAYEIVSRLQKADRQDILKILAEGVNATDRKRGKLHEVLEPSFDIKECTSREMIIQKLDYMHDNPCKGVWQLAGNPAEYQHSSARFYITGEQGIYAVTHYMELEDIDLTKKKDTK
ncbi:MAG: hypothetical protein SFU87_13500 [Chitinophagaceae bacterium]|nr:hypothetical protein [Chitinophagaceae bacterium]